MPEPLRNLLVIVGALATMGLIMFVSQPDPDPFAGDAVVEPPFAPLTYGIHAFVWWDGGWGGQMLDWVSMMRFNHVKHIVAWQDIQPAEGAPFDLSRLEAILAETERRGLRLVARLGHVPPWAAMPGSDLTNAVDFAPRDTAEFAAYCGAVASQFAGRITAYQILNEPNLSREWGGMPPNAVQYVESLAACSAAIRAADPAAILISAGLSPTGNDDAIARRDDLYLQDMYDLGFQQYIDVVGVHAAGYDAPEVGPDDAVAKGGHRWMSFRRVEDLRKIMVANGDAARQVAILEVGWTTNPTDPTYAWYAVSEVEQADYLVRAYTYAADHWTPWVGLMSAIFIADPAWTPDDEEYWFSITDPRLTDGYIAIRPAFDALLRMEKRCGEIVLPAYPPVGETPIEPANPCP
ncbi:MAG: cellulase family glycosylhydrolase [Anaerolineae bacterium]|jgi:hypothetical protein|nr:cellulase family glycosylhydrolase [Anaerolineae bacterium]